MNKTKVFFEPKNYWKTLFLYSVPIIIAMFFFIFSRFANVAIASYYVNYTIPGSTLKLNASSILGLTRPLVIFAYAFPLLISSGMYFKYNHAMGGKSYAEATDILENSFISIMIISILISLLIAIIDPYYMRWISDIGPYPLPKAMVQQGIYFVYGLAILFIVMGLNSIYPTLLRREGKNKVFGILMPIFLSMNVLLSWMFIALANTGILGLIYSTLIIRILSTFTYFIIYKYSVSETTTHKFKLKLSIFKINIDTIKKISILGTPMFTNRLLSVIPTLLFSIYIVFLQGQNWKSFLTISNMVALAILWFPTAFISSANLFVSNNNRNNNLSNISRIYKITAIYIICSEIIILAIFLSLSTVIWDLFNVYNPTIYNINAYIMICITIAIASMRRLYGGSFGSINEPKAGVIVSILKNIIVYPTITIIFFTIYLYTPATTNVVFIGPLLSAITNLGITFYFFKRRFNKRLQQQHN